METCVESLKGLQVSSQVKANYHISDPISYYSLIKRPTIDRASLLTVSELSQFSHDVLDRAIISIRYEGYLKKQYAQIQKIKAAQSRTIPSSLNVDSIQGLRHESRDKLKQYQPKTLYDAQKIAGINPADITILMAYLSRSNS